MLMRSVSPNKMDISMVNSEENSEEVEVLSLTLPPDPDDFTDAKLFDELVDLTDYIEGTSDTSKSPFSDCLSNESDVDVEETVLDVPEDSPGGKELAEMFDYLTGTSVETDMVNKSKLMFSDKNENYINGKTVPTIKPVPIKQNVALNAGAPIIVSGGHSVLTIPKNSSGLFNTVKLVRCDVKQGGGPSYKEENCKSLSKSAIAARENREKKKKYVEELEKNVKTFSTENKSLRKQVVAYEKLVDSLQNEVAYLKSVLANQSTLSTLLKNIPGVQSVKLSTSESFYKDTRKRQVEKEECSEDESVTTEDCSNAGKRLRLEDHEYASNNVFGKSVSGSNRRKSRPPSGSGGVCLHVSSGGASLEFCSKCSMKASCNSFRCCG